MGGGGKSSSNTSTTNTNVSGQTGIEGDNLGVAVSGVNGPVNITATDHGAVEKSFELGNKTIETLGDSFGELTESNTKVATEAMNNMRGINEDSLAALGQANAQAGVTARAALKMSDSTAARSQTGSSQDMTKVAIAVAGFMGLAMISMAYMSRNT
ncbi:hypothetical protein MHO82_24555 [Vibrio sp. Of7-15]|uniref:hypothetical protein n=1 Tax=Vibrio sp. Of7-15 TaxID=2724879 RepID=UPI001EF1E94D|nr:hypothetical protein [Vibrio sp. Of7-15]MCG7500039.1 hypothetical protein [Vibrio sp. Of7-15]